jgi:hypothetical protein
MFDGRRDSTEVLSATAGMGVTTDDLKHLVSLGFLLPNTSAPDDLLTSAMTTVPGPLAPATGLPQSGAALSFTAEGVPTLSAQNHYSKSYLTAGLGLRGFRLNLAVEAAADLDKLKELAPKIREAVGAEKFLELKKNALYY